MSSRPLQLRVFTLGLFIALAASSASAAEDWPQFGGPTGQGISAATGVPVEWSATKNVAWKVPIPGRAWSSPVLMNGKLYLTTAIGTSALDGGNEPVDATSDTSLRAMCVDAKTGKIDWDVEVFHRSRADTPPMHPKNSQASPTPVVIADRLYVHYGHLGTAALDLSAGKVLWRQTISYKPAHGNGGSPVIVDGLLVFNCDGLADPFVCALDASTGDVKWKTPRNSPARKKFSVATPQVIKLASGATQLISPASGFVGAYDPKDGREIWRVRYGEGYSVVPRPAFADGVIVLSSGYDKPVTYAIKVDDRMGGDVTGSRVAWKSHKAAPCTPSPLIVDSAVYLMSDNGFASCSDLKTGKVHWTQRLEGEYSASPVYAEGRVYFQSESGVAYVVKAATTFEQLAENDIGERCLASYAVADGALFIRSEHHLWKIAR
jgi:outer membrane protein assembly factor BamB